MAVKATQSQSKTIDAQFKTSQASTQEDCHASISDERHHSSLLKTTETIVVVLIFWLVGAHTEDDS